MSCQAVYLISEKGGGLNVVAADICYLLLFRECEWVCCHAGTSWYCRKFKCKKSHIFQYKKL